MQNFDFFQVGITSWLSQGIFAVSGQSKNVASRVGQVAARQAARARARVSETASALLIGASICAVAPAEAIVDPGASAYSVSVDPARAAKQSLLDAVEKISALGDDWLGQPTVPPSRQAVSAAMQVIPALPAITAEASAGVDGDGNVFFKFQQDAKFAYLTIEPTTMHLLLMAPGKANRYFDDFNFKRGQLPGKIRAALESEMIGEC